MTNKSSDIRKTRRPSVILDLWLNLGFLQVSTELMHEVASRGEYVFTRLRITLLGKWGFDVNICERAI